MNENYVMAARNSKENMPKYLKHSSILCAGWLRCCKAIVMNGLKLAKTPVKSFMNDWRA